MAYDLETLRRGRQSVLDNIEVIEAALVRERAKLAEYERCIVEAETILRLHGVDPDGRSH